ncbi:MAG: tetratricopeptide repeat protein [Balneola sp.]
MSKNFSKEELEHDPLLDKYTQAVSFFNANRTMILSLVVALVVAIGAIIGYKYYAVGQEDQAQNLLAVAEQSYSASDYQVALNGDEYTLSYGFVQIADEFSGTNAGNLATYYAAVSYFKLDNYEDALAYIQNYKHPKGIMGVGSVSFHATLLELNGSLEQAATKFEDAANWDENDSTTPFNLIKAANIYKELGNTDKVKAITSTIIEEYPDSPEATTSQKLLGTLAAS